MTNATADVTVYVTKGSTEYECVVTAQGSVTFGGSNGHGSDEPAWVEVSDLILTNARGKRVSRPFMCMLSPATIEYIETLLIESL